MPPTRSASARWCTCGRRDAYYPVIAVERVREGTAADADESKRSAIPAVHVHVSSSIAVCKSCGGQIPSPELVTLARLERQQRKILVRLERLEASGRPQSSNGNGASPNYAASSPTSEDAT